MVTSPPASDEVLGIGGDHVVRLEARQLDLGDAEGLGRLADQGELRDQLGRRVRAVRLVVGVDVVAEGQPAGVEHHRQVAAAMVGQEARQHLGEAEHGIHRRAVRPGHRRQGVEGAEDVAGAVDQDEVRRCEPGSRPGLRSSVSAIVPAPGFRT